MYNQYDESETYLICLSSEEKKARKRPMRPKIINHTNKTAQIENKIVPLPLPDCKAKPNSKQGKAKPKNNGQLRLKIDTNLSLP